MKLKQSLTAFVAIALSACSADDPDRSSNERTSKRDTSSTYATGELPTAAAVQQQATLETERNEPSSEAVAETIVGRALGADGAIPETERTEQFAPGEEIHVAVRVRQPTPDGRVRVAWFGPNDDLLGEDARQVSQQDEYVSFSMTGSEASDPGEYRAEIWMDDVKVDERRFAVVADRRASTEERIGGG